MLEWLNPKGTAAQRQGKVTLVYGIVIVWQQSSPAVPTADLSSYHQSRLRVIEKESMNNTKLTGGTGFNRRLGGGCRLDLSIVELPLLITLTRSAAKFD